MRSRLGLCRYTSAVLMVAACLLGVRFLASCQKAEQGISEDVAYLRGLESWVYGYPLVIMDATRQVMTAAPAPNTEGTAAPINQFDKMPHYVDPNFKNVVRISLNSLWSTAWLDLDKEPMVLSVPDTHGRYYVMSMMSMWTNVFGSVGKRTTGTGPGLYLIVGPTWQGTAPPDLKVTYKCPTRYAWVLGQTQANGPSDFAAVNAIQANYKLTPLSAWGKPYTPPAQVPVDSSVDVSRTPSDQVAALEAGAFFKRLAMAMRDNPPAAEDESALRRLKDIGVEPGKPFDISKVSPAIARGLERAVKAAPNKVQEGLTKMKTINGWMQKDDLGRYGVLVQPEMERRRFPLVSVLPLRRGFSRHQYNHQAIRQHGCIPAEPASVSPGKIIVAPPRPSVSTSGLPATRT